MWLSSGEFGKVLDLANPLINLNRYKCVQESLRPKGATKINATICNNSHPSPREYFLRYMLKRWLHQKNCFFRIGVVPIVGSQLQ